MCLEFWWLFKECFLDITSYADLFDLTDYAQDISKTALQRLGLPCCVGIGLSKTEAILAQVDVGEVWGVDRQNCKKLNTMNIRSILDLIQTHPAKIKKQFSIVM